METELHSLEETLPAAISKLKRHSSIIRDGEESDALVKYTSLKDVILNSPRYNSYEGNAFDSTNISIRNQLVKHAASAYLQSAAVLSSRNQNCLVRMWRRMKNNATLRSCWFVYVRNPLGACFQPICRFLGWTIHEIGRFWTRRITIAWDYVLLWTCNRWS